MTIKSSDVCYQHGRLLYATLAGCVHTDEHVMAEFFSIRDQQRTGDVLFFDDYTPDLFPGVVAAADRICREHGYAGVAIEAEPRRRYLVARKT